MVVVRHNQTWAIMVVQKALTTMVAQEKLTKTLVAAMT
jgi:hypothetical protein